MRCLADDECGFWPVTNAAFAQERQSFRPIPARHTRCAPSPACAGGLGRGWYARLSLVACTPPSPPPHAGEGNAPSVLEQRSRRPDEIDHGGLVRVRREADGGGAGGGKRLRDLAGETKVHERERALEHAGALGAIEI